MKSLTQLVLFSMMASMACSSSDGWPEGTAGTGGETGTGGMGGTAGVGLTSDEQTPACVQYVECVASASPVSLGTVLDTYSPTGSCWGQGIELATLCDQACVHGMVELSASHPSKSACWYESPCHDCARPPDPPDSAPGGDGPGVVLAIHHLYMGDTDRKGVPSPDAWKEFGHDIDGINSNVNPSFHCKGGITTDGNDGIDNAFGAGIVPMFYSKIYNDSTTVNDLLRNGGSTILLEIDGVGSGENYLDLSASLYCGANHGEWRYGEWIGSSPKWDGTDPWPLFCECMQDCKEGGTKQFDSGNRSKNQSPNSYVTNGTWVSAKERLKIPFILPFFDGMYYKTIFLDIHQAIITVDLVGTPPKAGTNGIISGVIDVEEFEKTILHELKIMGAYYCDPNDPYVEALKEAIRGAADIMKDGTQDPNAQCNGISFGMGFEMKKVLLGEVLDRAPAEPDPCGW